MSLAKTPLDRQWHLKFHLTVKHPPHQAAGYLPDRSLVEMRFHVEEENEIKARMTLPPAKRGLCKGISKVRRGSEMRKGEIWQNPCDQTKDPGDGPSGWPSLSYDRDLGFAY
ncbi:unnamed protein product [Pleuronectes platessa]|uniref:Uncharacterized protein n=1 Tax=Pleuronectes platessa TaxID=8262 RepID=A0A9N7V225_PLEPL|nr:unnamed protein product [Pleuronectes platessa]